MTQDNAAADSETKAPSELKAYTESNRQAWNEVMPLHQKAAKAKWDTAFMQPGFVRLPAVEVEYFNQMGIAGKNVAHLCCNNGIELLSLKNLGAGACVGFDICDEAIKEAQERAQLCHIDCRFVRSDVYEIGDEYSNSFDLIYISTGCLGWLPELPRFFARAAALLRADGSVFIHEIHPFCEMLPFDTSVTDDPLRIVSPYFTFKPYVEYGGLDYVGNAVYEAKAAQYWFVHTLSEIVTGLIGAGMALDFFREYDTAISPHQKRIEDLKVGVPLSYMMVAHKP
jgi:ubiquinone/menaquinone biosynthesis C-methylase UbiE